MSAYTVNVLGGWGGENNFFYLEAWVGEGHGLAAVIAQLKPAGEY
jgi:hypothetical protein